MPYLRDHAVVLRAWEFSETSQTVCLLTREHGIVRGLAKGSRRERSTFSGGFEPLAGGDLVAIVKPGVELATLTHWHLRDVVWSARRSWRAQHVGMFLADAVYRTLSASDPHPAVHDALQEALGGLGDADALDLTIARFLLTLLTDAGYAPDLDADVGAGGALAESGVVDFLPARGGFSARVGSGSPGAERWGTRWATVAVLRSIREGARPSSDSFTSVRAGARLLAMYLQWTIARPLPSLPFALPDHRRGGGGSHNLASSVDSGVQDPDDFASSMSPTGGVSPCPS